MTLPLTGIIKLSDIQAEFGGPMPPRLRNYYLNGANVHQNPRGTIPAAGLIKLKDFYGGVGGSGAVSLGYTISANTEAINIRAIAQSLGWDQVTPLYFTLTIDPEVIVRGTSPTIPAITTGTAVFPSGSKLVIVNNGYILGSGGAGGDSSRYVLGQYNIAAVPASAGGDAIVSSMPLEIQNNSRIFGGGGGGGYSPWSTHTNVMAPGAGGGGGAGSKLSHAGLGGQYYDTGPYPFQGGAGTPGSFFGPGKGGQGTSYGGSWSGGGGKGGDWGSAGEAAANGWDSWHGIVVGSPGGAGGYAVRMLYSQQLTFTAGFDSGKVKGETGLGNPPFGSDPNLVGLIYDLRPGGVTDWTQSDLNNYSPYPFVPAFPMPANSYHVAGVMVLNDPFIIPTPKSLNSASLSFIFDTSTYDQGEGTSFTLYLGDPALGAPFVSWDGYTLGWSNVDAVYPIPTYGLYTGTFGLTINSGQVRILLNGTPVMTKTVANPLIVTHFELHGIAAGIDNIAFYKDQVVM